MSCLAACVSPSAPPPPAQTLVDSTAAKPTQPQAKDTIWIAAVGDMVPATNYPADYLPPDQGRTLFTDLLPWLQGADLTFGNFEGVIRNEGGTPKACGDPRVCYRFRIPDCYADRIQEAGFDILNISSNHIDDFGPEGRYLTERKLNERGMYAVGLAERPCTTFVRDGIKYGFCAYAPFMGCAQLKDYDKAAAQVAALDSICDIVIVSFHGGAEGPAYRHVVDADEVFLGFNRGNMYKFARKCIDAGADLMIGHGPHVVRALELYKDRLIIYSLGNFCTYGRFALNQYSGRAPLMRVGLDRKGRFVQGEAIPIKQIERGIPRYDSAFVGVQQLRELTAQDFPQTPLTITETGQVLRKQ